MKTRGFSQISNKLIQTKVLNSKEKEILFFITSYNPSYPSYSHIQELLGLGRSTISVATQRLEALGILEIVRGSNLTHKSNTYKILPESNWKLASPEPGLPLVLKQDSNNTNKNNILLKLLESSTRTTLIAENKSPTLSGLIDPNTVDSNKIRLSNVQDINNSNDNPVTVKVQSSGFRYTRIQDFKVSKLKNDVPAVTYKFVPKRGPISRATQYCQSIKRSNLSYYPAPRSEVKIKSDAMPTMASTTPTSLGTAEIAKSESESNNETPDTANAKLKPLVPSPSFLEGVNQEHQELLNKALIASPLNKFMQGKQDALSKHKSFTEGQLKILASIVAEASKAVPVSSKGTKEIAIEAITKSNGNAKAAISQIRAYSWSNSDAAFYTWSGILKNQSSEFKLAVYKHICPAWLETMKSSIKAAERLEYRELHSEAVKSLVSGIYDPKELAVILMAANFNPYDFHGIGSIGWETVEAYRNLQTERNENSAILSYA